MVKTIQQMKLSINNSKQGLKLKLRTEYDTNHWSYTVA